MADIERYLSLVTSEHSTKPKFMAMLTSALTKADIDIDFDTVFDLDSAVGAQLDICGAVLGLSRRLTFQPSDGSSAILNDGDYRALLRAKVVLNQWNGEFETLTDALNEWNPSVDFIVKDNQNMSLDIIVIGTNQLQKELIANGYVVPKPAGVSINYLISEDTIFAYEYDTETLAGYGTGKWI